MTIRAFIAAAGSADLLDLLLASLEQYAPDVQATVIDNRSDDIDVAVVCAQRKADHIRNPKTVTMVHGRPHDQRMADDHGVALGVADHASALDFAKTLPWDYEIAVVLDSDVVILSDAWRGLLLDTLTKDQLIGAWGATWPDDSPVLHPMCLAMRAEDFRRSPSFASTTSGDTGAAVCRWLERHGYYLSGIPVDPMPWTLDGVGRWWVTETGLPIFAHLGGGTHSDGENMTRTQRLRHWRAIRDRRRFIRAAENWLRERP